MDHFVPFRRKEVLEMCLERDGLDETEGDRFRALSRILEATFHFEFQARLDGLRDAYVPFDPDRDTRVLRPPTDAERADARRRLLEGLEAVLVCANYVRVSEDEIHRAMEEESLFRIRLHVNFDDLQELRLYRRGETVRKETLVRFAGLSRREIDVATYERVLMLAIFADAAHFEARERPREGLPFRPGSTILKLFSDIPCADLEMLLPNSEVRMKTIDKVAMGVPALVTGVFVVVTKLAAVIGLVVALVLFWLGFAKDRPVIDGARLVALGAGLAAIASYAVKQWLGYKNRKIRFMKTLTENLYYKNLANNSGVLAALVDRAEGEELKETLLAYRFLLEEDLAEDALDRRIETWFRERYQVELDFDAEDALAKLLRLRLAERRGDGTWRAVPLEEALSRLDETWDAYFDYPPTPHPA